MTEIIPAIIPKSFAELTDKLSKINGIIPIVQIDVCDGKFTPDASWPNILSPDHDFVKIIHEEEAFPYSDELEFEIDLMVADPLAYVPQWISAGAQRIIPHIESFSSGDKALQFAKDFKEQYDGDGSFLRTELGMAINIDTPNEALDIVIQELDFVQCMGISKIGYQAQPFDERVLDKIRSLKAKYPDLEISVDGGVSLESAPKLILAGANRLVVGSAIFGSDDIVDTIEQLENL